MCMWKVVERKVTCDSCDQPAKNSQTHQRRTSHSICLAAVATVPEGTITHRIGRRRQNTISLRTDRAAAVRGSFRLTVICKKTPHFIAWCAKKHGNINNNYYYSDSYMSITSPLLRTNTNTTTILSNSHLRSMQRPRL